MARLLPSAGSTLGAFALASILSLSALQTLRAGEVLRQPFDGLTILAEESGVRADGAPTIATAFARIREALSVLRERSPGYYQAIMNLDGQVYIKYDPGARSLASSSAVAVFQQRTGFAEYDANAERSYVAVLGAQVVQWSAENLAGIIVHEIVGHGHQYAQNRLHSMNNDDRECEARLHQLRAHQDLAVASGDSTVIEFRTSLEDVWCRDFSDYLSASRSTGRGLWATPDLDAGRLLAAFDTYRRYGARVRWGAGPVTDSFSTGAGQQVGAPDADTPSLRGAEQIITYARIVLRGGT